MTNLRKRKREQLPDIYVKFIPIIYSSYDNSTWASYSPYEKVKLMTLNRDLFTIGYIEGCIQGYNGYIGEVSGYGRVPTYGRNSFNNTKVIKG